MKEFTEFSHVDFWSSNLHALLTDKVKADSWLNKIGVATPKIIDWRCQNNDQGPWFSKPRNGFGSNGTCIVGVAELKNLEYDESENLLIQELCEKPEVTVDSFFDYSTDECFSYCRERIETKSGVCTKARIFYDPELNEFARKIGRALNQRGTLCFQVMKSKNGWVVTDLNLRSGAGTAMTCAAGFDVLSAAYACRIGEDYHQFLKPLSKTQSIFVTRQYSEFIMNK